MLSGLNLNHLRLFTSVYRHRSMTLAARELHLTQSGISQHVQALENDLGVRLFDRVKQKLIPTEAARDLYNEVTQHFSQLEETLWRISGKKQEFRGTVRIGTTVEFGYNVITPIIGRLIKKYPGVDFRFQIGLGDTLNSMLLEGDLDFAFVDEMHMNKGIRKEAIYKERLELCYNESMAKAWKGKKFTRAFFEELEYITYDEQYEILRRWFTFHMRTKNLNLRVRSVVSDASFVYQLILHGDCVGILPGHLVDRVRGDGEKIYSFPGSGKPLVNQISLAYIEGRSRSFACEQVFRDLKEELAKI